MVEYELLSFELDITAVLRYCPSLCTFTLRIERQSYLPPLFEFEGSLEDVELILSAFGIGLVPEVALGLLDRAFQDHYHLYLEPKEREEMLSFSASFKRPPWRPLNRAPDYWSIS